LLPHHLKEHFSKISLSATIPHKPVPSTLLTGERPYIPLEFVDLAQPMPADALYFTVGVIVEVSGPTTAKTGKTYFTLKLSTLEKYDISKLKRFLFPKIPELAASEGRMRAADKSFTMDGYKQLKVLAFGEDLCRPLAKKIGFPGMVIALTDLRPLDFSENSGQALRIENES
jgi:hypothetical protein